MGPPPQTRAGRSETPFQSWWCKISMSKKDDLAVRCGLGKGPEVTAWMASARVSISSGNWEGPDSSLAGLWCEMTAVTVQSWLCWAVERQLGGGLGGPRSRWMGEGLGGRARALWLDHSALSAICPSPHCSSKFLSSLFSVLSLVVCLSLCVWLSESPLSQSTSCSMSPTSCSASPQHFLPPDKTPFYLLLFTLLGPFPLPIKMQAPQDWFFSLCSLT